MTIVCILLLGGQFVGEVEEIRYGTQSRSVLLELGHAACTVSTGAYRSEGSTEPVK